MVTQLFVTINIVENSIGRKLWELQFIQVALTLLLMVILDIVARGWKVFDKLIVGVLVNVDKVGLFSYWWREGELIKRVTKHLDNVEVVSFNGLLVDLAKRNECKSYIKRVRELYKTLCMSFKWRWWILNWIRDVEILFMTTSGLIVLSSSSVKQVAKFGGKINGLVPDEIVDDVIRKIKG